MHRLLRLGSIGGAAALTLFLVGCGGGPDPQQQRPSHPRPPAGQPAAPAAAAYFAAAASTDLFEVRSSQLALTRARNPRLRDFARMMISAHNGTAAQLSLAGRRLNLLPTTTLQPRHQAMLDELTRTGDFDFHYRRQQINVHEDALRLHSTYAVRGGSPTLRPVAKAAVPIIRRHLEMLRRI